MNKYIFYSFSISEPPDLVVYNISKLIFGVELRLGENEASSYLHHIQYCEIYLMLGRPTHWIKMVDEQIGGKQKAINESWPPQRFSLKVNCQSIYLNCIQN